MADIPRAAPSGSRERGEQVAHEGGGPADADTRASSAAEAADSNCFAPGHAWEYRKTRAGSVCTKCGQGDQDWIPPAPVSRPARSVPTHPPARRGGGGLGTAAPVAATPGAGLFGGGAT